MSLKVGDLIPIGGGGYSLLSNVENFEVNSVYDQMVRLNWKDPNDVIVDGILITEWAGTQIRGKKGNYPSNEKDGVLFIDSKNRNQYQNTPLEITGLDNDDEYFFMAFPYTDKNVFTVDSANRISATPIDADDPIGSPGNLMLIAGTMEQGYFGVVPSSELITGDALSSMVGISAGTSQFSSEGWLKFAYQGKIQFVAKKPIRHSISWDDINSANCVYGDKTVTIGKLTYKVRLMRGANTDPAGGSEGAINHNSEWNKLMLPIHINAENKNWAYPNNVEANVPYWGIDLTDADLHTNSTYGNGGYSWCQEVVEPGDTRILRANSGVSYSRAFIPSGSHPNRGFRPVLELVEVEED